jgi:hypothetical protein
MLTLYIQQDATLHALFYLETTLHVSGGTSTPSSGAHTTVSTAPGISHTAMDKVKLLINMFLRIHIHFISNICWFLS